MGELRRLSSPLVEMWIEILGKFRYEAAHLQVSEFAQLVKVSKGRMQFMNVYGDSFAK